MSCSTIPASSKSASSSGYCAVTPRQANQAHDVLQQPADISVMHGHRRRRALHLRRNRRIVHHVFQQPLDPRIPHRRISPRQLGIKLFHVMLRVRQKIRKIVIAFRRPARSARASFPSARCKVSRGRESAPRRRLERFRQRLEVVPHFRGNRAGAVAQRQFQPGFPAALRCADVFRADQK